MSDSRRHEEPGPEAAAPFSSWSEFSDRHRLRILGVAALFVAAALAVELFLVPPAFEATASLIIRPATFRSDLEQEELSVQAVQRLLESDSVVQETVLRLVAAGDLPEGRALRVGSELGSRVFVARRAEETVLAPLVEARATASDAREAATIANTWVAVLLEHTARLAEESLGPGLDRIVEEFERAQRELEALEEKSAQIEAGFRKERLELAASLDAEILTATTSWDRRLGQARRETQETLRIYRAASRAAFLEWGTPSEVTDEAVQALLRRLARLRMDLAQTPAVVVLQKAPPEETLWEGAIESESGLLQLLPDAAPLHSEEVNPIRVDLLRSAIATENDLRMHVIGDEAGRWIRGLEDLQEERSAGLSDLQVERAQLQESMRRERRLDIERRERERERQLADLDSRRRLAVDAVGRELVSRRRAFERLAEAHAQVAQARAHAAHSSLFLASAAAPPSVPRSRHLAMKVLLAAAVGAIAGIAFALSREAESSSRE